MILLGEDERKRTLRGKMSMKKNINIFKKNINHISHQLLEEIKGINIGITIVKQQAPVCP